MSEEADRSHQIKRERNNETGHGQSGQGQSPDNDFPVSKTPFCGEESHNWPTHGNTQNDYHRSFNCERMTTMGTM